MGRIVHRNQPCLKCPSSDAAQVYEDGGCHCFSCGKTYNFELEWKRSKGELIEIEYKADNFRRTHQQDSLDDILSLPSRGWQARMIIAPVAEAFGCRVSYNEDGSIDKFYFPFYNEDGTELIGFKSRDVNVKANMSAIGSTSNMFGIQKFRNGGKKIVVTEGEIDALSIATADYKKSGQIYPVVSMGGVQQLKFLLANRDVLRRFDEVIIYFDNDEQGREAAEKAARIIGADKVKVVYSPEKDANETLTKFGFVDGGKKISSYIWNAKSWSPAGVMAGENTWDRYKAHQNLTYIPWPPFLSRLGELTFGRALGTITMFAAGTSVGKSSLLREDIYHILKTTDLKIGACFLEEDIGETTAGIMGLHLNKRLGLPTVEITEAEELTAWAETVGLPGRTLFLDHQGSVSDDSLIDKIEFMALSGCKLIYLDHITIAISEVEGESVNSAIDRFMSSLLRIVKRYNVWVGVVSHLRKVKGGEDSFESGAPISEDDLKGSGSLKQISFQTIAISRNKYSENEKTRNRTQLFLLKDRKTGNTGPAGGYVYDVETGRMKESKVDEFTNDDNFEVIAQ